MCFADLEKTIEYRNGRPVRHAWRMPILSTGTRSTSNELVITKRSDDLIAPRRVLRPSPRRSSRSIPVPQVLPPAQVPQALPPPQINHHYHQWPQPPPPPPPMEYRPPHDRGWGDGDARPIKKLKPKKPKKHRPQRELEESRRRPLRYHDDDGFDDGFESDRTEDSWFAPV